MTFYLSTKETRETLDKATAQLEEKQVVLDKLGRFGHVLDMLKATGEALGAVSIPITSFRYFLTSGDRFILLLMQQPKLWGS